MTTPLRLAGVVVRLDVRRVERDDGVSVALTEQEARLLEWLAARIGEVAPRDEIAVSVLGHSPRSRSRAVDHAITRLRTKIEIDPAEPRSLLTVHGVGYRLVAPLASAPSASTPPMPARRLVRGPVSIDLDARTVLRGDEALALTDGEVALLAALDRAGGRPVPRDELARRVRGRGDGRALDHLVHRVRSKIEPNPDAPVWLLTERGRGYRLATATVEVPQAGDAFVGRGAELGRLRDALVGQQVVVLVGPAGIGKSRLATEFAARSATRYDAVYVVPLGRARDEVEALAAVAGALGVGGPDVADTIGIALANRGRALLLLDDLDARHGLTALLPAWSRAAVALHVVATSREVSGAGIAIAVPPLSVDGPGGEAASLFLARAARADLDARLVEAIVARLDGIPLAIELAAGRLRVMGAAEILSRLDRPLDLLVAGSERSAARHATMRAAIDASVDLLSPPEREAYARLGVFRGAFGLDAAEAVLVGGEGWPANQLQTLVERSLVAVVQREPAARFRMYDAIRAHAVELAGTSGLAADASRRHARHYARHGEDEAIEALFDVDGPARRAALGADMDEVTGALEAAVERGDAEVAGPLVAATAEVLLLAGRFGTLAAHAERALGLDLPPAWRARVLRYAGIAAWFGGRSELAIERVIEADRLATLHGTPRCALLAASNLGWFACDRGRLVEARGHYARASRIAQDQGFDRLMAAIVGNSAIIDHEAGLLAEARLGYLAASAVFAEHGDLRHVAMYTSNLALVLRAEGDDAAAAEAYERAERAYLDAGDRRGHAHCRINHATLVRAHGDLPLAADMLKDALEIARSLGVRRLEALALGALAFVQADLGRIDDAIVGCSRAMLGLQRLGEGPMAAVYQAQRGWLRVSQGQVAAGMADLDAAIAVTTASAAMVRIPKLRAQRGDARRIAGDPAGAAADFDLAVEEARALEPSSLPGILALRVLLDVACAAPDAPARLAEAEAAAAALPTAPDAELRRALDAARRAVGR